MANTTTDLSGRQDSDARQDGLPGAEDRATLASDPSAAPGRTADFQIPAQPPHEIDEMDWAATCEWQLQELEQQAEREFSHESGGPKSEKRLPLVDAWVNWLEEIGWKIGGWILFATFTFASPTHPEQADRQLRRYLYGLQRRYFTRRQINRGHGLSWVVADEYQRRGVLHFHVLIGGHVGLITENKNNLGAAWWKQGLVFGVQEHTGIARVENVRQDVRVRAYTAKYVSKNGLGMHIHLPAAVRRSWSQLVALRHIPVGT